MLLDGGCSQEIQIFETDGAELQALGMKNRLAIADDQFHRPAADIHHHGRLFGKSHAVSHAEKNQPRFLGSCDDADGQAGLLRDMIKKLSAVSRLSHGTGRHGLDPFIALVPGQQ